MARTKILFLAWGHSIHAQRRIQLFCDDPRFEVGVFSSFNYGFANARNFDTIAARTARLPGAESALNASVPAGNLSVEPALADAGLFKRLYRGATAIPIVGRPIHEAVNTFRDAGLLRKAIGEFQPDLLFMQTLQYPSYLHLLVDTPIPRMITFWNGDVIWWAKFTGAERLFKKQIVARSVRGAAAVTVNSLEARKSCEAYGGDPKRIHLIRYPGVDLGRFVQGDKTAAKAKLGLTAGQLILAPRGTAHYQNLDIIVAAAPKVLARHPDVRFMFLSPGSPGGVTPFGALEKQARELGVAHAMEWRGNVPHGDLPVVLQAADVVLSISSEDSTPNSMLEAMAARVPLVMGDIKPIRDWITHEENGLLVPPRDAEALAAAILRVLDDQILVEKMTEASYRIVAERAGSESQIALVKELALTMAKKKMIKVD